MLCASWNRFLRKLAMRGMSSRSPMYQRLFCLCQPFILEAATHLQNLSSLYPARICNNIALSIMIERTALIPTVDSSGKQSGGSLDRASATALSSPQIYVIDLSYCDKNSCQRSWHLERSFWESKFSKVRWSVYMWISVPSKSDHHFLKARIMARSSFSWTG